MDESMLAARRLPELLRTGAGAPVRSPEEWQCRRQEIAALLQREYLGHRPQHAQTTFHTVRTDEDAYGGKAVRRDMQATVRAGRREAAFPFSVLLPKHARRPLPVFVALIFSDTVACGMGEELIDRGYALAHVQYGLVEPDDGHRAESSFAALDDTPEPHHWGKIGEWAFAASCAADYLQTLPDVDARRMAVIGHSRLGLTALWCGAMDERFSLTVGVNAGALYRGSECEQYTDLMREYTRYWFCEAFFAGRDTAEQLPFDMHFLLSLIAPRHALLIGATRDQWTSPRSQALAAVAASPAYALLGTEGLVLPDTSPEPGRLYGEGRIGFYLRDGVHYFGREEWLAAMAFRERHHV